MADSNVVLEGVLKYREGKKVYAAESLDFSSLNER